MRFSTLGKSILVAAMVVALPATAGDSAAPAADAQTAAGATALAEARQAVAFDRHAEADLALASREERCRFSAGRNPVRPRRNECRLA
jgi:hypothetical protein